MYGVVQTVLWWGKGLMGIEHWLKELVYLFRHVVVVDFLQDGLHVWLSELRLTSNWFKDRHLLATLICLAIALILAFFLLFNLHLLNYLQHFLVFLHISPRRSVLPSIVLLLDLQHLVQINLRQSLTLLRQQSQPQCNGGIMMRKCQYLYDECQFIDAPSERFILKDVDDQLRSELPWCMAHCSIKGKDFLQLIWVGSLGQPLQLSTRSEEPLQVTSHHVNTSLFCSCTKRKEIGNLHIDLITIQQCFLHCQVLLEICWVKHEKTLKMRNVTITIEQGIEGCIEGFVKWRHEEHPMRLFNLTSMETLQIKETLIPIQIRHLRLFQLRMMLQLKYRVALHKLRYMTPIHKVQNC